MSTIRIGPARTDGPPPSRPERSSPRTRHLRSHAPVVGWLLLTLLAGTAQGKLPVAHWLSVHLFLLGAVTSAILTWSEHFAVTLLHARLPDERWSTVRLVAVNAAVAGVVLGVWSELPLLTGGACLLLVAAVAAHLVVLVRMGRGAFGGRLRPVVGYYRVASVALIAGAVLGWLLAVGGAAPERYDTLRLAHLHVTLLGWIGLPVLGTLFMLWPTALGVHMHHRTTRVSREVLWLTGGGLLAAVSGLAHGSRWFAAGGVALYAAGTVVAAWLFARTVRGHRPVSAASAWSLAAGICWLLLAVTGDAVLLATRSLTQAREGVGALVSMLLIGFVAQVLIGALTYLLPVVLSGGPRQRAAVRAALEWAWLPRLVLLNAGVVLVASPLPAPSGLVGLLLAALSGAASVVLLAATLTRSGPTRGDTSAVPSPSRRPMLAGTAVGVALTVVAVLAANTGRTDNDRPVTAAARDGGAPVRTVDVTLENMTIRPGRIEVTEGTALRLRVTNKDGQRHDVRAATGQATPMLGTGERHTLDLGPVTDDLQVWCTVPGHRAAGMTLDVVVKDAVGERVEVSDGGHSPTSGPIGQRQAADFSKGWQPRSAELPAASDERVHRVELRARRATVEVAPGVEQEMWTFGGTVPGPTLRGRVGDVFEITLVNDDDMGHGIDFHAGALAPDRPMRTIEPGERLVYRFRAEKAGAWLYHCGTAPMLQHIGNGMYGAVIIDPPDLPEVDHEYALVSSELYLGAPGGEARFAKMRRGTPDAWAFNGAAFQYRQAPLTVRAGERTRFWVVNAGPGDGVSFHIVGTVFDTVYKEGSYLLRPDDPGGAQALDVAPAQGGFVETTFPEAGHYTFVDHDMVHADSGAHGTVEVTE